MYILVASLTLGFVESLQVEERHPTSSISEMQTFPLPSFSSWLLPASLYPGPPMAGAPFFVAERLGQSGANRFFCCSPARLREISLQQHLLLFWLRETTVCLFQHSSMAVPFLLPCKKSMADHRASPSHRPQQLSPFKLLDLLPGLASVHHFSGASCAFDFCF